MAKSKTASFVLTLPMKTTISDDKALDKYTELSRKYYNAILGKLLKRLRLMQQSKEYRQTCKMIPSKERSEMFKQLDIKYGLIGTSINKLITSLRVNEFKELGSHITIKLELRAMIAIDKLKFHQSNRVNFVQYGEMMSFESSNNEQGIRYRNGFVVFNKLKMPIIVKSNDEYVQLALQSRVKFCRMLKKQIGNKTRYYVQLVMEGIPPQKHKRGIGEVGIDIGTSTVAIVSDSKVKLKELAEGIDNLENIKTKLQRKLDRQRRANNPNKYNEDGTINRSNRDKWIKSKKYIKTQNKLRDIQRKIASQRKQSHEMDANYILGLGNIVKVEIMSFKGLQKRAKNTTKNKKGKFNKKKRFGKSLANKAPAMLLEIVNRKLKYDGLFLFKVNTYKIKASQYNPITDGYNKKQIGDRWNENIEIQRDLLSALIIKNVILDKELKLDTIDKEKLLSEYGNFKELHDKEIERLKELKLNGVKLLSSMGI